jgi:hypothetical protein
MFRQALLNGFYTGGWAPVAQWKSSGFLNRVHKFDSCRGHY